MKKRSYLSLVLAFIMVFTLVGCDNGSSGGNVESPTKAETVKEPTTAPENTAEPTEAPTPTAEPTEAPTPTEIPNPNVLDGFDFTEFNEYGTSSIIELSNEMDWDSLRIIAIQDKTVEAVLKDGDSFTLVKRISEKTNTRSGTYFFGVYLPKPGKNIQIIDDDQTFGIGFGDFEGKIGDKSFHIPDDVVGEDIPLKLKVTYQDDTEEIISIFLTKDYVIEF